MENEIFENEYVTEQTAPKKKRGWGSWLFGGLITAAVAAVVVIAVLIFSNNYKTPVKLMEKRYNTKKTSTFLDNWVKELNGLCEEECKEKIKIIKKSSDYEELLEGIEYNIDEMKDEFGDNYKIKLKIVDKEKIKKDDLKELQDEIREEGQALADYYGNMTGMDYEYLGDDLGVSETNAKKFAKAMASIGKTLKKAKVSTGYILTVRETITGSKLDEPVEGEYEMYVFKLNGRWVSDEVLELMCTNFIY